MVKGNVIQLALLTSINQFLHLPYSTLKIMFYTTAEEKNLRSPLV